MLDELKPFLHKSRSHILNFLAVVCLLLAIFGAARLIFFSTPMLRHDFIKAQNSPLASNRPLALYDLALSNCRQGNFEIARDQLSNAFNALTQNTGVVPANEEMLAARIQFLLGVVNERLKLSRVAISAYEECLRHDPDNMDAKYNLERLKSQFPDMGKGGSSSDPTSDPNSKAGKDKKKGI